MSGMTMSKIMGASPGTTGYEDGSYLSDKVLKNPSGVLLLDEIEKTNTDILHLFMRIMDEGKFTDSQGRDVYFSNLTIIMTTNIGCSNAIGFIENANNASHGFSYEESRALDRIEKYFPTEFLNRIDDIIVFRPLDKVNAEEIIRLKLREYQKLIKKRFRYPDSVIELLRQQGFSEKYGARNLRRAIDTLLGYEIANLKLKLGEDWDKVKRLKITTDGNKIRCKILRETKLSSPK
jgi:ATP-dependent Clp protease ATP-binding subunit ClpA